MNYRALVTLLRQVDPSVASIQPADVEVSGMTNDSRAVRPGFIYAALPGSRLDGASFLPDAASRGAVAVLTSRRLATNLPQLLSHRPRYTLARLASLFHGEPSHRLNVVGITGTNGKTTSAYVLRQVLEYAATPCGLIGTVECRVAERTFPATMTTPEAPEMQLWLAEMARAGQRAAAMEVSSHALTQDRVAGTRFAAALFTNLTQDHLDFHETMQAYFEAKARLFQMLPRDGVAVVNSDDPWGEQIAARAHCRVTRYGLNKEADVRAVGLEMSLDGVAFDVVCRGVGDARIHSPLTGHYNVLNLLGVIATATRLGIGLDVIARALRDCHGAPGRLERVRALHGKEGPMVFVDYAHTPDALENVCRTVRELCHGRKLVTVFGCGGDRDRGKRPLMGRIAERLSDHVVITSDNPRREDPRFIIDEILGGLNAVSVPTSQSTPIRPYDVEPDRATAIRLALRRAGPQGVVLIAGKGHEDYQVLGAEKVPFDDREQANLALAELEVGS